MRWRTTDDTASCLPAHQNQARSAGVLDKAPLPGVVAGFHLVPQPRGKRSDDLGRLPPVPRLQAGSVRDHPSHRPNR